MIDLREIYDTIDQIKRTGTTVGQAEKLALLYIAADHMEREEAGRWMPDDVAQGYSQAAKPDEKTGYVQIEPTSDFLEACNGARAEDVLRIVDEHMEAIAVLYPREYEKIINMIENEKSGRA